MDDAPSADALLAEMQEEGKTASPFEGQEGRYGQEVSASYAERRACAVRQANGQPIRQTAGVKKLRYTHEDCVDRIIMSPGISENDLAQVYGVTPNWMSIVINCDAFRAKLAERRQELIDPALLASLNERYGALAAKSVDILLTKLNQPLEKISDKLALEAAQLGAKAMGLGEQRASLGPSASDHLASIAHRLIDLNRPTHTFDVPSRVMEGEEK